MRKLMLTIIALIAMVTFIRAFDRAVESTANEETVLLIEELPDESVDFFEN